MKKFYLLTALFLPLALMAYHHEVNETSPKELVSQAYETFAAGDSTAWAKLHTADLSFTVFGDLPQSGIKIGTDAVITGVFEVIPKYWPKFQLSPISTVVSGNQVFVHNKMTADNLDSETMHVFTIRDGRISSFTAFEDTDSMRKAMVE